MNTITQFITSIIGQPNAVTTWYWLLLIAIFSICFEAFWRRWFGGWDFIPKWLKWLKWLNSRFVKHPVNCIFLFAICYWVRGIAWYWSLYFMIVFEILFWTTTFGMYFDIGRKGKPVTEYDVSEYNKSWFAPILNWIFPEPLRYTSYYDYIGMFIRFTAPLLLLFWIPTFNSGLIFLGTIVSMTYGLCWVMAEKYMLKKLWPTELAEIITGAFAGLYIAISF